MFEGSILRWWRALAAVFAARTAYAGLVHGPLVLTPLVYARFPTAMNPALNLPALLAVEALVSLLLVASFGAYFRTGRPGWGSAALFGLWFGAVLYVPQNLLNWILLSPVRPPLVAAWMTAGLGGGVVSALVCRAFLPRSGD
ncbi:MAG: hypothetical protein ACOYXU_01075 [Nitrospirota bacterium]